MRHIREIIFDTIAAELLRVAREEREWIEWVQEDDGLAYSVSTKVPTWTRALWTSGQDALGMYAISHWLLDGPKLFQPSADQCESMEQVDVGLRLSEYAQPYPALYVDFPDERYNPFVGVLCHHTPQFLTCSLMSGGHQNDIVTTVSRRLGDRPIEDALQHFDSTCADTADVAVLAMRVALNSCLLLADYGASKRPMLPKQLEDDRRLAREQTERGERARYRVRTSLSVVTFAQDVKLHDEERRSARTSAEPTGREVGPHWRRGHWAMLACGKGRTERRRTFRRPTLVRGDLFVGQESDTTVTYRGK